MCFENPNRKLERTIFTSGEHGLLQMISKPGVMCQRGRRTPKGLDCEIPKRNESILKRTIFANDRLRRLQSSRGKVQKKKKKQMLLKLNLI